MSGAAVNDSRMRSRPVATLEVVDQFAPSEWDCMLEQLDGGFFHSSAWVHIAAATGARCRDTSCGAMWTRER